MTKKNQQQTSLKKVIVEKGVKNNLFIYFLSGFFQGNLFIFVSQKVERLNIIKKINKLL